MTSKRRRGPAVLARGDQAVVELDLGGARVRLRRAPVPSSTSAFGSSAPAATMPRGRWYLKLRPDQAHAVREQRRGERVAGMALQGAAVEAKAAALACGRSGRPAAGGWAECSSGGRLEALGRRPASRRSRGSRCARTTLSHCRQPATWCHHSRCRPAGWPGCRRNRRTPAPEHRRPGAGAVASPP